MKIYHRDYEDLSPGRSYVLASDYDAREKEHDIELSDAAMREQALTAELAETKTVLAQSLSDHVHADTIHARNEALVAELASALARIQELEDREDALEALLRRALRTGLLTQVRSPEPPHLCDEIRAALEGAMGHGPPICLYCGEPENAGHDCGAQKKT